MGLTSESGNGNVTCMSLIKRIQNKGGKRKPVFDSQTIHFWRERAYKRDYKKAWKIHQEALRKVDEERAAAKLAAA